MLQNTLPSSRRLFATTYPVLATLNFMRLATPESAILSAVIFNALIIIALIPLGIARRTLSPSGRGAFAEG